MIITVRLATYILMILMIILKAQTSNYNEKSEIGSYTDEDLTELAPFLVNEEYIRQIHSMINAYKDDSIGGRMVIQTNALIDTKYKTWKRNADLINSILALPKGMNDAGR